MNTTSFKFHAVSLYCEALDPEAPLMVSSEGAALLRTLTKQPPCATNQERFLNKTPSKLMGYYKT